MAERSETSPGHDTGTDGTANGRRRPQEPVSGSTGPPKTPNLAQSEFGARNDFGPHTELKEVVAQLGAAAKTAGRLLVHQTPEEGGFSLVYLYFKPNFPLFRHRHENDCLYVLLSGSARMGNQTLRAGDSFFVPAYAPYFYTAGPEGVEVLEIRHNADRFTVIFAENPPTPARGGEGGHRSQRTELGPHRARAAPGGQRSTELSRRSVGGFR